MLTRSKFTATALAVALIASTVVASSTNHGAKPGPSIRAFIHGEVGTGIPDSDASRSYFIQLAHLCVADGPAQITKVAVWHSNGGLRVTSWGVHDVNHGGAVGSPTAATGDVTRDVLGFSHDTVIASCKSKTDAELFDISAKRTKPIGHADGVIVYTKGARPYVMHYGLEECATKKCPPAI